MALQQKVLKECSKILLEIENAKNPEHRLEVDQFEQILSQRYTKYKQRKQYKDEAYLPVHEFVALSSITANSSNDKPFLFEKTKLSFTIMCSNCDMQQEPMINLKQFEKWSTKLYPLATKQNYKRVFLALASDSLSDHGSDENGEKSAEDTDSRKGSFGRLRQRVAEYKQSNKNTKKLNTSAHHAHDKSVYGGITMQNFCGYVDELIRSYAMEQNECQGIKISLESHLRSSSERFLYHIRGVSDMTGLPPYYGFVILTDYHLIFQGTALTTRTTCIKLNDNKLEISRAKIGGFLKRDTALRVCCSLGTFTWNVVQIKSIRRDELYWSIWTMIRAHELASNVKRILNASNGSGDDGDDDGLLMKIKRRIIVEAADDVLRQNALSSIKKDCGDKFDAVAFVRYALLSEKKEYVLNMRDELNEINKNQTKSTQNTLSSILFQQAPSQNDDAGDPLLAIFERDFERDSAAQKLNKIEKEKREEFDLREFFKYIKILRIECEPLIFMHRMYLCIILWKNRGLSMLIWICLQLFAYFDYVQYIPAIIFIANGLLLISMRNDMEYTLNCFDSALIFCGYDPNDFDQEKQAALKYAQKYHAESRRPKSKWSIMYKIKSARYKFYYNRFSMGFHQKKLARLTKSIGKLRTIYKWNKVDKSQTICLLSIACGFLLMILPARYIFGLLVFGLFFKNSPFRSHGTKKKKSKKGVIDTFFESIPPDIPQVDSEDDDDDSDAEEEDDGYEDEDHDIEEEEEDDDDDEDDKHKVKRIKKRMIKKMKKTISNSADDTDT